VHETVFKEAKIKEYMDAHGGQKPPDSFFKKNCKKFCGCLLGKERHIDTEKIAAAQAKSAKAWLAR
jgi:hypothetical protein